jgi:hypothetical protein
MDYSFWASIPFGMIALIGLPIRQLYFKGLFCGIGLFGMVFQIVCFISQLR